LRFRRCRNFNPPRLPAPCCHQLLLREREREREREKFIDNQEVTERADDGGGEGWEGRRTGRVTRLQRVRHTREFGIAFVYRYTLTEKQQREEEEARHHIDACVDHVSSIHRSD
jgi:hypothetical protein